MKKNKNSYQSQLSDLHTPWMSCWSKKDLTSSILISEGAIKALTCWFVKCWPYLAWVGSDVSSKVASNNCLPLVEWRTANANSIWVERGESPMTFQPFGNGWRRSFSSVVVFAIKGLVASLLALSHWYTPGGSFLLLDTVQHALGRAPHLHQVHPPPVEGKEGKNKWI